MMSRGFEFTALRPPAGRTGRYSRGNTGPAVWPAVALGSLSSVALSSTALHRMLSGPAVGCKALNSCRLGTLASTNRARSIRKSEEEPKDTGGWTLHGHDTTAKVTVTLLRVKLADGQEWVPKEGESVVISGESRK